MHIGYMRLAGETDTVISLAPSRLTCPSCLKPCQELLVVPKKAVGRGEQGSYRVIRCLDCLFEEPFFVRFDGETAAEILPIRHFEKCGFLQDGCLPGSKASIAWEKANSYPDSGYTPTLADGDPVWLQAPEYPTCPKCRRMMPFILQLSSDSLDIRRNKHPVDRFAISIEYYATLYFFVCEQCNITCSITQSD